MKCTERHGSIGMGVCQLEREDYIECLHHKKLVRQDGIGKGSFKVYSSSDPPSYTL